MAGTFQNTPLDEIQYRRPEVIQWWGGIKADTSESSSCQPGLPLIVPPVHPIIRESPFFDHTSKNGLLWHQAQNDQRTWDMCCNREAFEGRLKSLNGVEYVIVGEPQQLDDPALVDTGVWVIRKQDRKKRAPREDEVTILGTYYIVGENMYQAPPVFDIVANHTVGDGEYANITMTDSRSCPPPLP